MLLGQQRVDRARPGVADRLQDLLFADHQRALLAHDKMSRRTGFRGTGLDRPPFAAPFLPAAVEHRCIVEAKNAQHPPDPRRPPRIGGAVEHDPRDLADVKTPHRGGKCLGGGQHEAQAMVFVREIALQIDELRAGDMAFFEIGPPGHNLIGNLRVRNEMRRTVENSQIGVPEPVFQRLGFDQEFGMLEGFGRAHAGLAAVGGKLGPGDEGNDQDLG